MTTETSEIIVLTAVDIAGLTHQGGDGKAIFDYLVKRFGYPFDRDIRIRVWGHHSLEKTDYESVFVIRTNPSKIEVFGDYYEWEAFAFWKDGTNVRISYGKNCEKPAPDEPGRVLYYLGRMEVHDRRNLEAIHVASRCEITVG